MLIRTFEPADYPFVKIIYQQGIDTGNATFQITAKNWEEWNASMLCHSRIVAVENNSILGWAALSPVSSREVYSGVAEVSVYVAKSAQGKGVGQKLLSSLIKESEKNNIWMLQAGIFPENIGSLQLHKNNGFRQLGIREKLGKMNGVWRDVVLIERRSSVVGV
ncbi:GNAT family N-acetyltransferase [Thalassotalea sediminis]|uniref:GNAT family N-acetyltransferase n=1 Tax=Thalassotalea sediminis TaxID=1759089 RepID=UPI002572A9E1|nr:GNAT family N-acetyltransferase [Thalassotalea sediminis]